MTQRPGVRHRTAQEELHSQETTVHRVQQIQQRTRAVGRNAQLSPQSTGNGKPVRKNPYKQMCAYRHI